MKKKIIATIVGISALLLALITIQTNISTKTQNIRKASPNSIKQKTFQNKAYLTDNSLVKENKILSIDEVTLEKAKPFLTKFYTSTNFHGFVNENLSKALAGDPKLQFYIAKALSECEGWSKHPKWQSPKLFEEYMNSDFMHSESYSTKKNINNTYQRCKGFIGENIQKKYGDAKNWYKKSSDFGYPSAAIHTLSEKLTILQNQQYYPEQAKSITKSAQTLVEEMVSFANLKEPNSLLDLAYQPIDLGYPLEIQSSAWTLLACKYGMPCKKSGEQAISWLENMCTGEKCFDDGDAFKMIQYRLTEDELKVSYELMEKIEIAIKKKDWNQLSPKLKKSQMIIY